MTTTTKTPDGPCWAVLCWGRVLAGPEVGGPPWVFISTAHATLYAAELRNEGIDAEVREWLPAVFEWKGQSLVRVPRIPAPKLEDVAEPPPPPPEDGDTHNHASESSGSETPANGTPLAPPPSLE